LDDLLPSGYKYYHYDSSYDGSRDKYGFWINADDHMSVFNTTFLNEDNLFFIFLENNKFMSKYTWFLDLTEDQILDGPWWISKLFRKYLNK
jgi:hypothetical protein